MQRQNLLLTALIATISICLPVFLTADLRPANAEWSPLPLTVTSKVAADNVLASGDFEKSEHPTSGTAQITVKNGKKYLKFDSSFQSDNGPDLFVILHRQDSPKSYAKANYVSLGRLKKVSGQQMYSIPNGVDVAQFKSVAIWCRKFNATFGFAPLN
jgi:Electron transfer DM13